MQNRSLAFVSFFLLVAFLMVASCRHEHEPGAIGRIIDYDLRECVCCGGIFIEHQSDTLLFPEVPVKVQTWIDQYGFPLTVLMDFKQKENACPNFYELTSVELLSHK